MVQSIKRDVKESFLAFLNSSDKSSPIQDSTFDIKASGLGHKMSQDER